MNMKVKISLHIDIQDIFIFTELYIHHFFYFAFEVSEA